MPLAVPVTGDARRRLCGALGWLPIRLPGRLAANDVLSEEKRMVR
ncbi:MAG: hypothetical protein ACOX6P_10650 [Candidatus Merdivicinus sp.]|jgi:hypothetical protein